MAGLFSAIAARYDLMNDLMTWGLHRGWKREAARIAVQDLGQDAEGRALDVATGTGDLTLALAHCAGLNRIVGVDLLPDMVHLAGSKAAAAGISGRVDHLTGDALALPFPADSFDCSVAGFSMRNMPSNRSTDGIQQALAEMTRVVRPGGRVVTLEMTPMANSWFRPFFRLYFCRLVPLLGQLVADNRAAYTYLPESVDLFPGVQQLADLFRNAGLLSVGFKTLGFGAVAVHWGAKQET